MLWTSEFDSYRGSAARDTGRSIYLQPGLLLLLQPAFVHLQILQSALLPPLWWSPTPAGKHKATQAFQCYHRWQQVDQLLKQTLSKGRVKSHKRSRLKKRDDMIRPTNPSWRGNGSAYLAGCLGRASAASFAFSRPLLWTFMFPKSPQPPDFAAVSVIPWWVITQWDTLLTLAMQAYFWGLCCRFILVSSCAEADCTPSQTMRSSKSCLQKASITKYLLDNRKCWFGLSLAKSSSFPVSRQL